MPCQTQVPCKPLPTIIREAGFPKTTYLSLDVEGSEERVMNTVPNAATSFPFDVVMVEADRHNFAKNARVRNRVKVAGLKQAYVPESPGSVNELFVRPEIRDTRLSVLTDAKRIAAALTPTATTNLRSHLLRWPKSTFIGRMLADRKSEMLLWQRLYVGLTQEVEALMNMTHPLPVSGSALHAADAE